jgi:hypothetical protein
VCTLVELDSEPLKRLNKILFCARNEARTVSIFDAKEELSAVFFCEKIVVEGGADAAYV